MPTAPGKYGCRGEQSNLRALWSPGSGGCKLEVGVRFCLLVVPSLHILSVLHGCLHRSPLTRTRVLPDQGRPKPSS